MKNLFVMILMASFASAAFATDGKATGCFDVAVRVPKSIDKNGPTETSLIKTGAVLCVMTSNMDEATGTGKIAIRMVNHGHTVSEFNLSAFSAEGAAGTYYTTYAQSVEDVSHADEAAYKAAVFAMRNDHIKAGQVSGRVTLFAGPELTLIER